MTYLFDTNVLSYMIQKNENVLLKLEKLFAKPYSSAKIPIIVYYEIMRGLKVNASKRKHEIFQNYCELFDIVGITEKTMDVASDIYAYLSAAGNIIEDADIFIAATALEHDFTLLTNNVSHIGRIDGLKFLEITQ